MTRLVFLLWLVLAASGASAQGKPAGFCMYGPLHANLVFSVGAKRDEIEIRASTAVDPARVACIAKMECTIKPRAVEIAWVVPRKDASSLPPTWSEVRGATIQYADGVKEGCNLVSIRSGPSADLPTVDPKLREMANQPIPGK